MTCPTCQTDLMISDCQGIETDFCPQCRGVWLDHGEIDKLIERASLHALRSELAADDAQYSR